MFLLNVPFKLKHKLKTCCVHQACETVGITLETYYTWLKHDKSFSEEFNKIKEREVK
ncbi:hypothetical protein B4119_4330 [Parageobacillus caldoxylosilyticus]|uniref:Uncharacterized protein n=1 Tax=Saccharococcus caldoxylosilyticus TaxID=81408 RepID=A0A150L5A3_9BACL|nr:hypothetical protein B4119_4330 [Parageobacillus caldoxylosilyticus]